jgi:hypothetical protein
VLALVKARWMGAVLHGFATIELSGGFGLLLHLDESFSRLAVVPLHTRTQARASNKRDGELLHGSYGK